MNAPASVSFITPFWRRYQRNSLATFGLALVAFDGILAAAANLLAPGGPFLIVPKNALLPPSPSHIMGVNDLGIDVFSQVIYGLRTSFFIGIVAALIVLVTSLAFVYAIVRLGFLILPVTVAEEQISLVRGWIVTKGNFWRIFAVVLAIGIPIAIAYALVVVGIIGPGRLFAALPADPAAQARALNERFAILQQHMPLYIGLNLILAPFAIGLNAGASAFAYRALVSPEAAPALQKRA